jgi:hypothetical protein
MIGDTCNVSRSDSFGSYMLQPSDISASGAYQTLYNVAQKILGRQASTPSEARDWTWQLTSANVDNLGLAKASTPSGEDCLIDSYFLKAGTELKLPLGWQAPAGPTNIPSLRPSDPTKISVSSKEGIYFDRSAAFQEGGSVERDDDKDSFPWVPVLAVASLAGLGLWLMMGKK